ncbi:MAG: HAD hydrolase-like protein [Clostridia bacterium]|nr:HAD hydrolase-like protein [Clostridia bacterium]
MNKKYKSILIDVDGTLIFSHYGLLGGHKYALKHIGMPEPDEKTLLECVGPSPLYSLKEVLKVPEDKLELAYILNRGYVYTRGYKEYEVIPGMTELVEDLYKAGYKLYTASTKAEWLCELCIESMNLSHCFEKICGAGNDGVSRHSKEAVINYAFECGAEDCVIIGDRKFDIDGAKECGIDSIGITFGYGTNEEIAEHNPTYICNSADDIRKILL